MTQLPSGWRATTLGELGHYWNGRAFKSSEWRQTGLPIIRIQNLTGSSSEFNYFDGQPEVNYTVEAGDLLVSWSATLGAYVWTGPRGVLNQHIFKVDSYIDARLHKYVLDHSLGDIERMTHGSGMVHVTRSRFNSIPVHVPESSLEQARLVEVLDEHFSHLSAATSYLANARLRLGRMRKAAWNREFLDKARGPLVPLLDVVTIANGQTPRKVSDRLLEHPSARTIPYYRVGDMNLAQGGIMGKSRTYLYTSDAVDLGLHIRPAGTVIFPKRGGAIATEKKRQLGEPAAYDLNTMGLTPSPALSADYLLHWLSGIELTSLATGSNVPQLNAPQLRSLQIQLPDLETQARVVAVMNELDVSFERVRGRLIQAERRRSSLERAVLVAAFSGLLTGRASDLELAEANA